MTGTTDSCIDTEHTSSNISTLLVGPFLNFESPAQRRGNVSRWKYCYDEPIRDIKAQMMVYRQNPHHRNQYDQVAESVTNLSINLDSFYDNCCFKNTHFKILENDIIGVCISPHDIDHPLYLEGATKDSNLSNISTYHQFSQDGYKMCISKRVQNINTNGNSFIRQSTLLRVYPIISGECSLEHLEGQSIFCLLVCR